MQISNGRKIARIAPISMIFGPLESHRRQLKFPKNCAPAKKHPRGRKRRKTSRHRRKNFSWVRILTKNIKLFKNKCPCGNDMIIFRSFEFFSNFRWRRCDSNGPKIIKIRAILAKKFGRTNSDEKNGGQGTGARHGRCGGKARVIIGDSWGAKPPRTPPGGKARVTEFPGGRSPPDPPRGARHRYGGASPPQRPHQQVWTC